jgi:hypothetical protein
MRCFFALVLLAGVAHAECKLTGRPWLESRGRRSADAKLGEAIDVFAVAPGRLDGRAVTFADDGARAHVPFARCRDVEIKWRRVEPRMLHVETDAPNGDIEVYANAVVFGPDHGKWIGFDELEYFTTELDARGAKLAVSDATPTERDGLRRAGDEAKLGVMRLAATIRVGSDERATAADVDGAFRYTFRRGDGFLGWLTSFYNVPYLFGSAGKGARAQAERYVGADCADVLVAALRRAGRRDLEYTSVSGLVDALEHPRDLRPGDLIALDYVGFDGLPGAWDHIVAFVEDRGPGGKPDGKLGPEDLVIDSGDSSGLKIAPLSEQGTVRTMVLRARGVPAI